MQECWIYSCCVERILVVGSFDEGFSLVFVVEKVEMFFVVWKGRR